MSFETRSFLPVSCSGAIFCTCTRPKIKLILFKSHLSMNFTEGPAYPNDTKPSLLEKNGSSLLPIDIEILTLGPEIYWFYQGMMSVEGTLGIVGNIIALIMVYKYEFLRENNGCRFIASLALADCFGGIGIFVSIARSVSRTIFRSV